MYGWPIALALLTNHASAGDSNSREDTPLAAEMRHHWFIATNARNAVVEGDLARARIWGAELSQQTPPTTLHRRARPLYAELQVAALALSRASDLVEAGKAMGIVGESCARCHRFTGGGPRYVGLPVPPQSRPESSDMELHVWGAEMLWLGLVTDNSQLWQSAADTLWRSPLTERPAKPRTDLNLAAMEQLTHLLPSLADTEDLSDMATRYGETISTCGLCHIQAEDAGLKPHPTIERDQP